MVNREDYPDDVRRVKDAMDLHAVAGAHGYAVFNLGTGKPVTNNTYPSRAAARKSAEKYTMDALLILEISPDGMPYNEAQAVLNYERNLFKATGGRTPDHFETEENSGLLSMPHRGFDRARMIRQLQKGQPLVPDSIPYGNLPSMKPLKRG